MQSPWDASAEETVADAPGTLGGGPARQLRRSSRSSFRSSSSYRTSHRSVHVTTVRVGGSSHRRRDGDCTMYHEQACRSTSNCRWDLSSSGTGGFCIYSPDPAISWAGVIISCILGTIFLGFACVLLYRCWVDRDHDDGDYYEEQVITTTTVVQPAQPAYCMNSLTTVSCDPTQAQPVAMAMPASHAPPPTAIAYSSVGL